MAGRVRGLQARGQSQSTAQGSGYGDDHFQYYAPDVLLFFFLIHNDSILTVGCS